MGLDHQFTYLLTQLGWSLPAMVTVAVIGVIALVRRDAGLWWKLVVSGAAVLVIGQLMSAFGTLLIMQLDRGYQFHWLVSAPALLLNVVGLGLLGAGAVTGRRAPTTTR